MNEADECVIQKRNGLYVLRDFQKLTNSLSVSENSLQFSLTPASLL